MTAPHAIHLEMLSDTTFSRGAGTAGVVDVEIDHDELGIPIVHGKTLHGLLRDTWLTMAAHFPTLEPAGMRIFGPPGDVAETAILHIGTGTLEPSVRQYLQSACQRAEYPLAPDRILSGFTDIRRQTAEDRRTGAPAAVTLRASRVALRGLVLIAPIDWLKPPQKEDLACLAMALQGTRNAGWARNRGRGFIHLTLDGDANRTLQLARGGQA